MLKKLLLVGLGNPGEEYQKTYHNVGAFLAPHIASELEKAGIVTAVYPINSFMNESGPAVLRWLRMQNKGIDSALVIHDDSDLALGDFRLSFGGGSAGHKGIESLVAASGSSDFWRLRVGVRDPRQISKEGAPAELQRVKAGEFVLRHWSLSEEDVFLSVARDGAHSIVQAFAAQGRRA